MMIYLNTEHLNPGRLKPCNVHHNVSSFVPRHFKRLTHKQQIVLQTVTDPARYEGRYLRPGKDRVAWNIVEMCKVVNRGETFCWRRIETLARKMPREEPRIFFNEL